VGSGKDDVWALVGLRRSSLAGGHFFRRPSMGLLASEQERTVPDSSLGGKGGTVSAPLSSRVIKGGVKGRCLP